MKYVKEKFLSEAPLSGLSADLNFDLTNELERSGDTKEITLVYPGSLQRRFRSRLLLAGFPTLVLRQIKIKCIDGLCICQLQRRHARFLMFTAIGSSGCQKELTIVALDSRRYPN
jgi:hypothetical protein